MRRNNNIKMKKHVKFMLLDADSTRTLACVRSFLRHSIPFIVGGETKWDMSFFSKHCKENSTYNSPLLNIPKFVKDTNKNIINNYFCLFLFQNIPLNGT